jgi:hypothetical protein
MLTPTRLASAGIDRVVISINVAAGEITRDKPSKPVLFDSTACAEQLEYLVLCVAPQMANDICLPPVAPKRSVAAWSQRARYRFWRVAHNLINRRFMVNLPQDAPIAAFYWLNDEMRAGSTLVPRRLVAGPVLRKSRCLCFRCPINWRACPHVWVFQGCPRLRDQRCRSPYPRDRFSVLSTLLFHNRARAHPNQCRRLEGRIGAEPLN